MPAFAAMGADGWIGRWYPGIGDPTIGGWITVAGYAAAAFLSFLVLRALGGSDADSKRIGRERALWIILSIALVFLGINKQLDLQSAMTEALRMLAKAGGWYSDRGMYQALFVVALGTGAIAASICLVILVRGLPNSTKLATAGLVLVIGYVLVRAASFHHFDLLIGSRFLGLKVNWILELGGIAIVALGSSIRWRSLRVGAAAEA